MDETDAVVREGCSSLLGSVAMLPWPKLIPALGWGQMTATVGPRAAAGPLANICPEWLCRRSRGFPTSCTNLGSVIHRQMLVVGADGDGQLGNNSPAWDTVPYPHGEIRDLLVS